MDTFFTFSGLVALITLTFLEIVLGVDNVIFISILASKLPAAQQDPAQRVGLHAKPDARLCGVSSRNKSRQSVRRLTETLNHITRFSGVS